MTLLTSSPMTFQTNSDPEIRLIIYRYTFLSPPDHLLGLDKHHTQHHKHLAIMRTNRQIHTEASALWYSELQLIVSLEDLSGLESSDPLERTSCVWRHDPLHYVSNPGDKRPVYIGPELAGGMEPYVFNRFKRVDFRITFDLNIGEVLSLIDYDFAAEHQDKAGLALVSYDRVLLQNMFGILRNSLSIDRLSVDISVPAPSAYDNPADLYETDKDRIRELTTTASGSAVDTLLECDLFSPLKCLTNVRSLAIGFEVSGCDGQRYYPLRRHWKMVGKLIRDVKRNWLENRRIGNAAITKKEANMVSTNT